MAIFCTKCGTPNEYGAAFCDNCGAPLRPASGKAPDIDARAQAPKGTPHAAPERRATSANQKKTIYAGVGLAAILAVGGGAMFFVLQPPAATASTLLAAAKAGYGKEATNRFKGELCIANTDYSASTFNAGENDTNTQAWMNALVAAGLYSPPVNVSSGGLFARNLLQYVATPELEKYREGTRLCIAKDVEIADVIDIAKPTEGSLGWVGNPPKILTVKTKLIFKSVNTAPWLEKPEVRDAVMSTINGWEYKNKTLQKQVADYFGLRDNKWTTGVAYKTELEKQYRVALRGTNAGNENRAEGESVSSGVFGGITSALTRLFDFGGNPLKGTWRIDSEGMGKSLGIEMPSGLGLDVRMTFTSNSIDVGGQSMKAKYEVVGKRVKVIPEGQAASMTFVMLDNDTATLDLGLVKMRYKRVE